MRLHWKYYRHLSERFAATDSYVEICKDNFKTYSVEYTQLLLAAASEADVVAKLLCQKCDPAAKCRNIVKYKALLQAFDPNFYTSTVVMYDRRLYFRPWFIWKQPDQNAPGWWDAYSGVKHERNAYYKEGNLENVLNALSALHILLHYLSPEHEQYHRDVMQYIGHFDDDPEIPERRIFPAL